MTAASPSEPLPSDAAARSQRSDGAQSRRRLCEAALQLFAQHGYARTSTRAIARAANANVAAISYHFGDKAGLYRAVFTEPAHTPSPPVARPEPTGSEEEAPLAQTLGRLFDSFVEPLRQGDAARQCMKLHLREILEPTGLWQHGVAAGFEDQHRALVAALCRHLGMARADAEVRRLALCIAGLGVQLHVGRDMADAVAPGLGRGPRALAQWKQRLLMYALAMVDAERQRRRAAAPPP